MSFRFISPLIRRSCVCIERTNKCSTRLFQTKSLEPNQDIEVKNEPIKYTTSKAGEWKAKYSQRGEDYDDTPRIQGLIIVVSVTSFMVYFCILREENDLDDYVRFVESNVPLRVKEAQLRVDIESAKKTNRDTSSLVKQLDELLKEKEKRMQQR